MSRHFDNNGNLCHCGDAHESEIDRLRAQVARLQECLAMTVHSHLCRCTNCIAEEPVVIHGAITPARMRPEDMPTITVHEDGCPLGDCSGCYEPRDPRAGEVGADA